jgi:GT2 family glycosyltransferase
MTASPAPRLSVIIPIYEAAATLSACVTAAVRSLPTGDVVVADDGSTDGGVEVLDGPLRAALTVVRSERNVGRGPIRNLGAGAAAGDVLVFVDADVVLHADALERIRCRFSCEPDLVALIGSYDDAPTARCTVSRYRNLLHHHTHQTFGTSATHFWTGIGAIRRTVFDEVGGFDGHRWAHDMEDVELGHRLADAGHVIVVDPAIQGTHMKSFTLRSMVRTDLRNRAIPWSRLMLRERGRRDNFVTSRAQVRAAASTGVLAVGIGVLTTSRHRTLGAGIAAGALVAFVHENRQFLGFARRRGGRRFAAACVPLHLVHVTTSVVGLLAACALELAAGVRALQRPLATDTRRARHPPAGVRP